MLRAIAASVLALVLAAASGAQQTPDAASKAQASAPVPAQILTAKKVFISNLGVEDAVVPLVFRGAPDRPFQQFYAAMKAWGHYELVSAPAECDLVFEISAAAPRFGLRQPFLRLVIRDPKTRTVLWTVIRYVEYAARSNNYDKNFNQAFFVLVNDVAQLASLPPAFPAAIKKPTSAAAPEQN